MTLERILKEIRNSPILSEDETKEFIAFLDEKKINEFDAGVMGGLNGPAFSVRKKGNKIPRRIKIMIELALENVELREKIEKVKKVTDESY